MFQFYETMLDAKAVLHIPSLSYRGTHPQRAGGSTSALLIGIDAVRAFTVTLR